MEKREHRIEIKPSRTAGYTCMCRAASFLEKNPYYKSDDYIAPKILPAFISLLLKLKIINVKKGRLSPKGMYEYIIARTKIIDKVFYSVGVKGFDQILIFGAGYDSRGIRLLKKGQKTKVFELDVPTTQTAKIKQFKKRGISYSSNIVYIPIDFNKETIEEKLKKYGFKPEKKTLFILEGLLMYLTQDAVDETFRLINIWSGQNSEVIFDYVFSSVVRGENLYYGEKEAYQTVKKASETWTFGIEKGHITSFLKERGMELIAHFNASDLEKKYFTDEKGNTIGKINGTHCIVHASKP
jgi:methyltransferase (TIGR00027 family)